MRIAKSGQSISSFASARYPREGGIFDDVALQLSTSNLEAIERRGIAVPRYDRAALVPRILHLGVGGFHRAHMALYTDELAAGGADWGIRGIGLLDADRRMADVLDAQDDLYTLIERDSSGSSVRIVGSIIDYALVAGDVAAFGGHLANPEVAILSMTITEGGYALEQPNPTLEAIATALEKHHDSLRVVNRSQNARQIPCADAYIFSGVGLLGEG